MTNAQKAALKWLAEHGGTGVFMRNGVLLAAGEAAPHERRTWNMLRDAGKVVIFGKRVRLVSEFEPHG